MEETYLEIAVDCEEKEQNTNSSVNINFTQGRRVADVKTSKKTGSLERLGAD